MAPLRSRQESREQAVEQSTWTISELADEFGITARTIRFYEEKKLLSPRRSGGDHRLFDKRDRTRLKLILRGKKFGLTLEEISNILGSATADRNEAEQVRTALRHFERVLKDLEARKRGIEEMEKELLQYMGGIRTRLAQLENRGDDNPY
ncbi:MerR family transcriptional regulator [bacterium]|nr:MAG: MerR family transcriptional regulator [bacterium]